MSAFHGKCLSEDGLGFHYWSGSFYIVTIRSRIIGRLISWLVALPQCTLSDYGSSSIVLGHAKSMSTRAPVLDLLCSVSIMDARIVGWDRSEGSLTVGSSYLLRQWRILQRMVVALELICDCSVYKLRLQYHCWLLAYLLLLTSQLLLCFSSKMTDKSELSPTT